MVKARSATERLSMLLELLKLALGNKKSSIDYTFYKCDIGQTISAHVDASGRIWLPASPSDLPRQQGGREPQGEGK
jgi:hypothetical protein